jgi:uncharacterized protein (TIGR02147 family)
VTLRYNNYRDFLQDELSRRMSVNPAYSQRAFAKSLGLSPGEISELLRGKRPLTMKSAMKIAKGLGLTSRETKHLLQLIEQDCPDTDKQQDILNDENARYKTKQLSTVLFDVVSEWYHFAILNLAECDGFIWSYSWIAKKLGLKMLQVKTAINKMVQVGLIEKYEREDGKESFRVSNDFVMASEGIPSQAIRNYHSQILKKAEAALEFQSIEERDITGIGMAIDPADMPSIKKDIMEFQDTLVEKYSKGGKKKVYQLEMAFFALSKGDTDV